MRLRDPKRFPGPSVEEALRAVSKPRGIVDVGGETLELTVGAVAHGGHCVARIAQGPDAGRVVFVRHALPGEKVLARITDKGKVWRADAIEILDNASPYRVPSFWPEAGPDGVGGGELAHVSPQGQRLWKAAVVAEQMRRLAGLDVSTVNPKLAVSAVTLGPLHHAPYRPESSGPDYAENTWAAQSQDGFVSGEPQSNSSNERGGGFGVEPAANWPEGAGYRTRIDLLVNDAGQAGMRQARSHTIVPLADMPLATDDLREFAKAQGVWQKRWLPNSRLSAVAPATLGRKPEVSRSNQIQPQISIANRATVEQAGGHACAPSNRLVLVNGEPPVAAGDELVEQVQAQGRTFRYQLAPGGFWQVHATAPETLVNAVLDAVGDLEARRVLELYSGAGLFTLPFAAAMGPKGKLVTVEGSKVAVEYAQQNLVGLGEQLANERAGAGRKSGPGTDSSGGEGPMLGKKLLPKTEQLAGSVDRTLAKLQKSQPELRFNIVLVDPPREGLGKGVVEQIAAFEPEKIVYVSCDPAALARDTSRFIQNGYHLTVLRAFDLFPMTHHVESVATFIR